MSVEIEIVDQIILLADAGQIEKNIGIAECEEKLN